MVESWTAWQDLWFGVFRFSAALLVPEILQQISIPLFRGIPDNRGDGMFYKSRYCEDRDNRGPDNRGLAVLLKPNKHELQ